MSKKIALLGSTGSIGTTTLEVVRHLHPEITVSVLAAKSNIDLLEAQAREFKPRLVAVFDREKAQELKRRLPEMRVVGGMEGLQEAAALEEVNFVISAMTGTAGILPTLAALEAGKDIGLANKEVLVSAGHLVMALAKEKKAAILPIDSEHSALFQCLLGEEKKAVHRLILTASGGPFYRYSQEELSCVTVEQALKHPNWSMGAKVTVDSSTLMNKGLEVIEAYWLFDLPLEQIEVVIHPESLVHSLVEYIDGSLLAQLSEPNMCLPIQYALTYPERKKGLLAPLDFTKWKTLQFLLPDREKFPCLKLAQEALKQGGSTPCYLNAANEVLVSRFLNREIPWIAIGQKLERLLSRYEPIQELDLESVLAVDALARGDALTI